MKALLGMLVAEYKGLCALTVEKEVDGVVVNMSHVKGKSLQLLHMKFLDEPPLAW